MKSILQRFLVGGLALGLAAGASSAAVTLTEETVDVKGDIVPVYTVENQYIKFQVVRGPIDWTPTTSLTVPDPYYGAIGGVLALYDKTGSVPEASQLTVIGSQGTADNPPYSTPPGQPDYEWPALSHGKSFIAFRDRMNARDPKPENPVPTISASLSADKSVATITVEEDSLVEGFHITKTYVLKDNVKWLQTDFAWANNSGADYRQSGTGSAIESIIYATPGGAKDANDISYAMVSASDQAVAGINATVTNQWYGKGGTPLAPALAQGWLSTIDPANESVLATTWDLAQQQAASTTPPLAGVRGGIFGSRFTFEILYETIPAGETLNFTHNLIVDNGLTALSYAKEGQLLAAVETDDAYNLESTATATFQLHSLNPTSEVTYDIKNIRVEDRNTGTAVSGISLADITGVKVGANAHVTAGTRQFTPRAPGFTVGTSYVVKGDLYQGANLITTLSSRAFQINAADAKVFLYRDTASGDYILENEVYRAQIDDENGQVSFFFLKDQATGELVRGQTVTSTPPYPMFRDFLNPAGGQIGFSNYTATLDPNGSDTGSKKTIQFSASDTDGNTMLTKTYSLESLSRTLNVNLNVVPFFTTIGGGGFYSEVPMAPGGTAGRSDRFSAHTANGLLIVSPPQEEITRDTEFWFGAKNDTGNIVAGEFPELDQPWMGMRDSGTGDALAVTWDLAKQKQFSPTLDGKTVTMNSLLIKNNYNNQLARVHFTNIEGGTGLDATMYLMGDTGFQNVSYAKENLVLAGLWANKTGNPAGAAFNATAGLTNTSTTAKTFDLKNIRIVKDTGESTAAGPDITGIALDAAAHAAPAITFTLAAGQAEGSYTILADLYEGATLVATLQSPAFNVTAGVPGATGDLDNSGTVDNADVALALKLAGGLETADAGHISRGDLNADGKITAEDAVAIGRKVNAL